MQKLHCPISNCEFYIKKYFLNSTEKNTHLLNEHLEVGKDYCLVCDKFGKECLNSIFN